MRRSLFALTLLVSGCATVPPTQPVTQPATVPATAPSPRESGDLIGLTGNELVGRLGRPALQIVEGQSLKIQFRSPRCVLDAYLYPGTSGGPYRVTHVDARSPAGSDMAQYDCLSALESAS